MIKTLSSINKQEKEKFKIPKKVQHIIPIERWHIQSRQK